MEDNAHGLFGRTDGGTLGTIGSLSTQSFHETKNVSCGEGGALIINDPLLVERAEILREKGTDRSRFLRGQVDKYTWVDVGSSWVLSDLLAALLLGQLERLDVIQARRRRIYERYEVGLRDWSLQRAVVLPSAHENTAHVFHLRLPSGSIRDAFISHLRDRGILAVFHYQPLHMSLVGERLGGRPGQCPMTEVASETLVRLPLYEKLSERQQDQVINAVLTFDQFGSS